MQPRANRLIARRFGLSELEEIQIQFSNYFRRRRFENYEDEALIEAQDRLNNNPNYMKEKDVNFRLYPFYINWKKLEENQQGYFRIFVHFGYFGAAIYSSFKEKYPTLNIKNILFFLSNFIPDFLLKNSRKDSSVNETIKLFFDKLPDLDTIYQIILDKIILYKEISLFIIVLKIYEIYFISTKNKEDLEKALKCEFLLSSYLTDEEYNKIYKEHYKGKIKRIFKKLAENKGKEYELNKTRSGLFSHIKYVYNKFIKDEHLIFS